tara:strand:- start:776 stop:2017 length:1242 start_codon:yes stop_codon:yes gene_type:complete
MQTKKYDWIVIGGGISGITIAEILSRDGKSVLLVEKNKTLASETSKVFHEWLHSGSLYSLAPDNLLTVRYLLGATDDLLEYYNSFSNMNLMPTESGIDINGQGWFNDEHIEYRYKKHLYNPIWLSLVSRSLNIIDLISNHDWLRRRAGSGYGNSKIKVSHWVNNITKQYSNGSDFFYKVSPDITMNSRVLVSDILSAAVNKGLKIITDSPVKTIIENEDGVIVQTDNDTYQSDNSVICSPDMISKFIGIPLKTSYAPMAIVENLPEDAKSFVELDYNLKKCINLLIKGEGIAQAGGVSMDKEEDVDSYLSYIVSEHKKRNPSIKLVDTYVGLKKELVQKGEDRNYLYHINQHSKSIWSVVLGKFSLAFSAAPEFYRRLYNKNPPKSIKIPMKNVNHDLISETSWKEIITNSRK